MALIPGMVSWYRISYIELGGVISFDLCGSIHLIVWIPKACMYFLIVEVAVSTSIKNPSVRVSAALGIANKGSSMVM